MKKYRLKIKYPSLFQKNEIGDIVYYNSLTKNYVKAEAPHYSVSAYDVENYPDFWELIEEEKPKPIFITEDGVEVFINNVELFAVNEIFETASAINFDFDCCKKEGWKLFFHKDNADEYIWRNKPQFSYEDIIRYLIHSLCDIDQLNHLVQGFRKLTKERIEQ